MGLDQFAYVSSKAGDYSRYYESFSLEAGQNTTPRARPRELAYWRKHPNLQGWMEQLWTKKGRPGVNNPTDPEAMFNGVELELTWEDIDQLEQDIISGAMSQLQTVGFFFGEDSDQHYRQHDLEFIKSARAELFLGLRVFYNSSW